MNKLFIIGNGFDLAHGLKSRYEDFLIWYLKKILKLNLLKEEYHDSFLALDVPNYERHHLNFQTLEEYKSKNFKIRVKSKFYERLIEHKDPLNWVDIESKYYELLVELFVIYERGAYTKIELETNLIALNSSFNVLKDELWEYLKEINNVQPSANQELVDKIEYELSLDWNTNSGNLNSSATFLNFNYTNTLELYLTKFTSRRIELNYIHGNVNDSNKNQIFGYGDELDDYYKQFERLNINEYLKHFKSFGYFLNNRYQQLKRFLDEREFKVIIMGHSCGLSDRLLFNTIFEHKHCKSIKIYYHQISEHQNDYFEKTQEISRHFTSSMKGVMRDKIVPFLDCMPLIKLK